MDLFQRIMERRYSDGLHQAIEAKEGVSWKTSLASAGQSLYQTTRMYRKLSGMTGTKEDWRGKNLEKFHNMNVIALNKTVCLNVSIIRFSLPIIT